MVVKKLNHFFSNFLYHSAKLDYLKQFIILEGFTDFELFLFSQMIQIRHFKADEVIFHEQYPLAVIYLIQKGAIEIKSNFSINKNPTVLHKDQHIGVIDLYDENRRKEEAKAIEETTLLAVSHIDFHKFIKNNPKTGVKLLNNICKSMSNYIFQIRGSN